MVSRLSLAFRENLLLILTLVGVALGIGIGFAVREAHPSDNVVMWLGLAGHLYLRLLKMMIVPLIVSSVTTCTASLDPKSNGKISMVAFVFIFVTNMLGALLGITGYVAFKPGNGGSLNIPDESTDPKPAIQTQDIFADLLRNTIPDNLFEATFMQTVTKYDYKISKVNASSNDTVREVVKSLGRSNSPNILGLIFACTVIGIAAASLKEKGRSLILFLEATSQTIIVMIRWFLWATPIGVFSLILAAIARIPDVTALLRDLGMLIAAVTTFVIIQQLILLPLVYFITTRRNPYRFLANISRPWLISFAAATTVVAIPEMLRVCETSLKVDKRIARFVIPFSVTLSANGSTVFIACSCLFVSSLSGTVPSATTILVIGCLTSVSSLAIPSVPSASIVTIIMILTSLNVPVEGVALLFASEFFLDRIRTASSAVSHVMCATVTHHMCSKHLPVYSGDDEGDVEMEIDVEHRESLLAKESSLIPYNGVV